MIRLLVGEFFTVTAAASCLISEENAAKKTEGAITTMKSYLKRPGIAVEWRVQITKD